MRNGIIETAEDMQKIKQIVKLEKQLDIAINTLKEYANRDNWHHCETENGYKIWFRAMFRMDHYGYRKAENALKEIDEVQG